LRESGFCEKALVMEKTETSGLGPWVDTHCHLADARSDESREVWIQEAIHNGIRFFMQGGVGPDDWRKQLELEKRFPIGLCFGLHPYFVAAHSDEECEGALDQLAPLLPKAMALGELGLDFRPHIMKDSKDRQIQFFEDQLMLAEASYKPMVLHLVQSHEEALEVFRIWGVPPRKGIVHSFNSSWPKAQDFIKLGLALSVGGPLVRSNNEKLKQAVREIPLEYLLLETDSPDQPPEAYKGQLNPLSSLISVAQEVARLKGMTPFEILDISTSNFRRIFGSSNADTDQQP
jgi:TatD DNase family protein